MSERRKSCRQSSTKRSLSAMFSSPSSSFLAVVSPPSLSPFHEERTDRSLTFLQSAKDRDVPVRFGKWSTAEDAYLHKLLQLFRDGLVAEVHAKTSLRSWLAQMLNCCPMRISKKQMHSRSFTGACKYKRNLFKSDKLSQQQYEQHCKDVWKLRAEFLRKWADEELERRDSVLPKSDRSFDQWYDKLLELVPTPKVAKPAGLSECREKRRVELLLLTEFVQEDNKRRKITHDEPEQETQSFQTLEKALVTLEPIPIPEPTSTSYQDTVTPLPLAFCSDTESVGDWLTTGSSCSRLNPGQWNELPSANHVNLNEGRYTICEDQVKFSFHLENQQTNLSMTRRSSRMIIDFGAPSGWQSGEEPKCSPFLDYSQWTDNDLTEEMATLVEPGTIGWDEMPYVTYNPPLTFL